MLVQRSYWAVKYIYLNGHEWYEIQKRFIFDEFISFALKKAHVWAEALISRTTIMCIYVTPREQTAINVKSKEKHNVSFSTATAVPSFLFYIVIIEYFVCRNIIN